VEADDVRVVGVVRGADGGVEGSCVNVAEVELLSSIAGLRAASSSRAVGKVRGSKRGANGGVEGAVEGSCVVVVEVQLLSSLDSSPVEVDDIGVGRGTDGGVGVAVVETELLSSTDGKATPSSRVVGFVKADDVGVIGVCAVVVEVELLASMFIQEELRLRSLKLRL
jgi:hypothetical protein